MPERLARAVADRVVSLVVEALDVDALVRRVDINAVLEQIDIDRLVERIDINALVAGAAMGSAEEVVTVLRRRAAQADDTVARWADGLMGRA